MKKTSLKFIDLFAGIGGFRLAFDNAGADCVLTCEIDRFARQSYEKNFPKEGHLFPNDITKLDAATIPEFRILCGGFPCQAFSLAGKKLGFAEARGTLFFDVARIIKERQPEAFLLENVKNLVSHDKGKTFAVISNTLKELGYDVAWKVVSARTFVPQDRQRIFMVGFRNNLKIKALEVIEEVSSDLSSRQDKHIKDILESRPAEKYTLSPKLWDYLQGHAAKHAAKGNGFGFGLMKPWTPRGVSRTLSARYGKDGSEILIGKKNGGRPRRLTPREAARLQGFPESFQIVVSDTQAYKQFGNAVAVPVVQMFAEKLVARLEKVKRKK